jgi:hypothetical protein
MPLGDGYGACLSVWSQQICLFSILARLFHFSLTGLCTRRSQDAVMFRSRAGGLGGSMWLN